MTIHVIHVDSIAIIMGDLAMKKLFNMMRGCKENTEYIQPELIVRAITKL